MTYTRGKAKAKKNNLKRFMNECDYLKQRGVLTLSDFEKHLSSVSETVESRKSSMHWKQTRLKELQQLMEDAKTHAALKPVLDEMKKEKYRFTRAKEKYKAEHEGELRRFYMVKRMALKKILFLWMPGRKNFPTCRNREKLNIRNISCCKRI